VLRMIRRTYRGIERLLDGADNAQDQHDGGFTIIEVVMAAAILLTVVMSVMATVSFAATGSQQAQRRQAALNLASWRIEQAHALPYASVGTTMGANITGSPAGSILAIETTGAYTINTTVRYKVDPDTNLPTYKIVTVRVSWTSPMPGNVTVTTNVMGTETLTGASVLLNTVDMDQSGVAVPGVLVTLDPYGTTSNQQGTTDSDGELLFGSVPTGVITSLTASCPGYLANLKQLMTPATQTVNAGANLWTLEMQKASSLTLFVTLPDGTPFASATVGLHSTDLTYAYANMNTTKTTDAAGMVYFPNLWRITQSGGTYRAQVALASPSGVTSSATFPMAHGGVDATGAIYPISSKVTIHVTDLAAGWDVQNATVVWSSNGTTGSPSAVTDAGGLCTLWGVPAGTVTFTATKVSSGTRFGTTTKTVYSGVNPPFSIYTSMLP
jgi:hypothetical protein